MNALLLLAWLVSVPLAAAALARFQLRRKTRRLGSAARVHRSRQLGEFLSYILFSVREYLTSVTSVTEQIALSAADPALKDLGGKLQRIVAELNGKLGRMLESAQIHTTTRTKIKEFDLKELLKACLESASLVFPDRAANVHFSCDPQIGPLSGDRETISCVFTSVIANALEALESRGAGGGLTISARLNGAAVDVEVADEGGGIPHENMDRIFSPLFTTKAASGGLGLGLSMSRRMMERCGGSLTLRSEDGRTVVQVRVPLRPTLPIIRGDEATWPVRRRSA